MCHGPHVEVRGSCVDDVCVTCVPWPSHGGQEMTVQLALSFHLYIGSREQSDQA